MLTVGVGCGRGTPEDGEQGPGLSCRAWAVHFTAPNPGRGLLPAGPLARPFLCLSVDARLPSRGCTAWGPREGKRGGGDRQAQAGRVLCAPGPPPPSPSLRGPRSRRAGRRPAGDTGPLLPDRRRADERYVQPGRAGPGAPGAPPPPPGSPAPLHPPGPDLVRQPCETGSRAPPAPLGHLPPRHLRGLLAHSRSRTALRAPALSCPHGLTNWHPKAQLRVCSWDVPSDSQF